ncbi:hypothetical protein M436DRAFT_72120 [Aureobasidium namibiae CBS 147.97]|uniref:ADF-H domain-containing protein n=1 Tax=Aureobasidium namibiae CBS 147.97 TaxID=1043004 RepID=A0A074WKQ0_9PEZI|nr:uncharacterized protein M436DRAFT_72120 [Aureobasidium namibiae CBS 147.97]KEQ73710.1 hypothetical protein M436DRAFT_72120 [Aureobasidium namibiae CBS 147.97]
MSLNGLDVPEVQQAYEVTLSEAGGWILVKYVSRDEIALLGHGQAGLSEARNAILQYDELSPLYGLVVYRRRKVLVKYVPRGTSRLLQARTTVHLREVQERWAPYETMLEIETADELNDTALAAAFPLHTASPALSSNQFSLNEITEDNEDGDAAPKPLIHSRSISSVSSRKPPLEKRPPSQRSYRAPSFSSAQFAGEHSPVLKNKSSLSQFLVREELGHKSVTQLDGYSAGEDSASIKDKDDAASILSTRTESAVPLTTSSTRTHTNESADYDLERYLDTFFQPKIKLGPRVVNVVEKGKHASASAPVSSLPAGVQFRPKQPLSHPQPQYPVNRNRPTDYAPLGLTAPPRLPSLHFSPQIPDIPEFLPPRPNSRGSSRSLPASRASKAYLSPEKQRLMKALEMRKRQLAVAQNVGPPTADNTGANKADSESLPSLVQEDLNHVAEASLERSDAQPVSERQATTLSTNSTEQPTMEASTSTTLDNAAPAQHLIKAHRPSIVDKIIELSIHSQEHIAAHGPTAEVREPTRPVAGGIVTEDQDHFSSDDLVQKAGKPFDPTTPTSASRPEVRQSTDTLSSVVPEEHDSFEPEIENSSDSPQKMRRRGLLEPLQIQFLADDDFMDELQTATFEQATPIAISKRPSTRSAKSSNSIVTAVSTESVPLVPSLLLPSSEPQSYLPTRTPSVSSSNVSSGISARIAALAEKSTRDGSPPVAPASRKFSYVEQSAEAQATGGAERRQVGKLSKARSAQPGNRDSVSVTARIVRVPRAGEPVNAPELQASPLLFNHQRPTQDNNRVPPAAAVTNTKSSQGEHDSVMSPQSRDGLMSRGSVDTSATGRRKSFDRKSFKSLSGPTSPKKNALKQTMTQPPSDDSPDKTSRTSRFFKRISHLGKDKKKSASQVPTITTTPSEPMSPTSATRSGPTSPATVTSIPESAMENKPALAPPVVARNQAVAAVSASKPRPDSVADVPPPVSIGDFNVQFPDAMLWKRRWIEIDGTGHLIFTAAARHSSIGKSFNSKFHLKELGPPFIPDMDRQEMPHSVICDLVHGEGSIQCASEDAMSQRQLLSLLTTYHQAWKTV